MLSKKHSASLNPMAFFLFQRVIVTALEAFPMIRSRQLNHCCRHLTQIHKKRTRKTHITAEYGWSDCCCQYLTLVLLPLLQQVFVDDIRLVRHAEQADTPLSRSLQQSFVEHYESYSRTVRFPPYPPAKQIRKYVDSTPNLVGRRRGTWPSFRANFRQPNSACCT